MEKLILVLDNLRSAHNVGSIIRSGVAFGIYDFIAVGTTPYPPLSDDVRLPHIVTNVQKRIAKTSLGAEVHANFLHFAAASDCIGHLQKQGIKLAALEQTSDSSPLAAFEPETEYALVIGNEIDGVSKAFLTAADIVLEISQSGPKESLNASVAAGIALYALTK